MRNVECPGHSTFNIDHSTFNIPQGAPMQVTKVADNLFLRGGEALLVEGMGSRTDAEALRQYVERVLGKRVRIIVSTHYFSDHMAALGLFPEAEIITHED